MKKLHVIARTLLVVATCTSLSVHAFCKPELQNVHENCSMWYVESPLNRSCLFPLNDSTTVYFISSATEEFRNATFVEFGKAAGTQYISYSNVTHLGEISSVNYTKLEIEFIPHSNERNFTLYINNEMVSGTGTLGTGRMFGLSVRGVFSIGISDCIIIRPKACPSKITNISNKPYKKWEINSENDLCSYRINKYNQSYLLMYNNNTSSNEIHIVEYKNAIKIKDIDIYKTGLLTRGNKIDTLQYQPNNGTYTIFLNHEPKYDGSIDVYGGIELELHLKGYFLYGLNRCIFSIVEKHVNYTYCVLLQIIVLLLEMILFVVLGYVSKWLIQGKINSS